jgi:hypothetical protein
VKSGHEGLVAVNADNGIKSSKSEGFSIRLDPSKFPLGPINENITFITKHPKHTTLQLPVKAELVGYVLPEKKVLFLGNVPAKSSRQWPIELKSDKKFEISNFGHDVGSSFRLKCMAGLHKLILEYDGSTTGVIRGEIRIMVDVFGDGANNKIAKEKIVIPVMGLARVKDKRMTNSGFNESEISIRVNNADERIKRNPLLHIVNSDEKTLFSNVITPPQTVSVVTNDNNMISGFLQWEIPGASGRKWKPIMNFNICPQGQRSSYNYNIERNTCGVSGSIEPPIKIEKGKHSIGDRIPVYGILLIYTESYGTLVCYRHLHQAPLIKGDYDFYNLPGGMCDIVTIGNLSGSDIILARHHKLALEKDVSIKSDLGCPVFGSCEVKGTIKGLVDKLNNEVYVVLRKAKTLSYQWDNILDIGMADAVAITNHVSKDGTFRLYGLNEGEYVLTCVELKNESGVGFPVRQFSSKLILRAESDEDVEIQLEAIPKSYGCVQYAEQLLEDKYLAFQKSTPVGTGELVNNNSKRSVQETVLPVGNSEVVNDSKDKSTVIASKIKLKLYAIMVAAFACLCLLFIVRHKMKWRQYNP